jgi:putative acetyltransferase
MTSTEPSDSEADDRGSERPAFSLDDVLIRAAEPEDFQALREIYAQPGAYTGTLQLPFPSARLWRDRLEHQDPDRRMLVAEIDGRVIGNIGLVLQASPRRRHVAGVGMAVHDAWAGRGVGELLMRAALDLADNWLNVHRVELTVYADNDRAIRLYERCGFEREGVHRDAAFREGTMVDTIAMARIR